MRGEHEFWNSFGLGQIYKLMARFIVSKFKDALFLVIVRTTEYQIYKGRISSLTPGIFPGG